MISTDVPIVGGRHTVESMRSNGYKSTDYALAELVDNSVESFDDAPVPDREDTVLIIVVTKNVEVAERLSNRPSEIWVIDNAGGMDAPAAHEALKFGQSSRYDSRKGLGRFGMGLPQASVSQARRTDLWSWNADGPHKASWSRLDLDVMEKENSTAPLPTTEPGDEGHEPLPDWVRSVIERELVWPGVGGVPACPSGTAIRWSEIDRSTWKRASSIKDHTEFLLGRIYRRYLVDGAEKPVRLLFGSVNAGEGERPEDVSFDTIIPNDPMCLMRPRDHNLKYWLRANPNWDRSSKREEDMYLRETDEPLFDSYGATWKQELDTEKGPATITIRAAMSRPEGRPARTVDGRSKELAGKLHQGKFLKRNRGVSVLRNGRELELDLTLVDEATDRWWSIEVDFDAKLDHWFGVTSNKQSATTLIHELRNARASVNDDGDLDDAETQISLLDPEGIVKAVADQIVSLRGQLVAAQKKQHDTHRKNVKPQGGTSASGRAGMAAVGTKVQEDLDETSPGPEYERHQEDVRTRGEEAARQAAEEELREDLTSGGFAPEVVEAAVRNYRAGIKLQVLDNDQPQADPFFWAYNKRDARVLVVNTGHKGAECLFETLRLEDEQIENLSAEDARGLLGEAADSLGFLLMAWLELETNEPVRSPERDALEETRKRWGKKLADLVSTPSFQASRAPKASLAGLEGDEDEE